MCLLKLKKTVSLSRGQTLSGHTWSTARKFFNFELELLISLWQALLGIHCSTMVHNCSTTHYGGRTMSLTAQICSHLLGQAQDDVRFVSSRLDLFVRNQNKPFYERRCTNQRQARNQYNSPLVFLPLIYDLSSHPPTSRLHPVVSIPSWMLAMRPWHLWISTDYSFIVNFNFWQSYTFCCVLPTTNWTSWSYWGAGDDTKPAS